MLALQDIPGNDRAKAYLTHLIETDRIGNALLFAGPAGAHKRLFARRLATAVLGDGRDSHPDLHYFRPEGKSALHPINAMRSLASEAYLPPLESRRKVFIIECAERMAPASANALLKTFEEPPGDSLIILVTNFPESLLATIRSRCRTLTFEPVDSAATNQLVEERLLHFLAREPRDFCTIVKASKELGESLVHDEDNPTAFSAQTDSLLSAILMWYRDLHLISLTGSTTHIHHKSHIQDLLASQAHPLRPIEKALSKARLAFARFTKPSTVLENLFLCLNP